MRRQLLDLVAPLRRPAAVVLWAGRPGVDYQLGSLEDLKRARRLLLWARMRRRQAAHVAAIGAAMARTTRTIEARFAGSARQAVAAIEAMSGQLAAVDAIRRAGLLARSSSMTLDRALELERQRLAGATNAATTFEALNRLVRHGTEPRA